MSKVILIAAIATNDAIGLNGSIPWHQMPEDRERYQEDLTRFSQLTKGNVVIVGGRTWREDLNYGKKLRQLSDRQWVVISRDPELADEYFQRTKKFDVYFFADLHKAIDKAKQSEPNRDIFIAGGAQIYRLALEQDLVDECDITWVLDEYPGDVYFPTELLDSKFRSNYPDHRDNLAFCRYTKQLAVC